MTKTTTIVGTLTVLVFGVVATAGAQVAPAPLTQGWVSINGGAQPQRRSFVTSGSLPIYGETATFDATHSVDHGAIFDINGGKRFGNLGVGVGFSTLFVKKGDCPPLPAGLPPGCMDVHSSVPSPLFFNSPQVQTQRVPPTNPPGHNENAVYLQGVYFIPITDKFEVTVGGGPSFFKVKQEVISRIEVPAGTQAAAPVLEEQSKSAAGGNVGFELNYLITPRFGAGLFGRYSGAKVDLPGVEGLKVGGTQFGIGARVRF